MAVPADLGLIEAKVRALVVFEFAKSDLAVSSFEDAIDPLGGFSGETAERKAEHALRLAIGNARALEYMARQLDKH